jgi:acetyl esterase/lipase
MSGDASYRQLWIKGIAAPEVNVFRPALPDGSSILVIPGGGYEFIAVQNEGIDAAERFNASRTTVFALTYRLPAEGWANRSEVPLQDAQRAMRLIRSRAAELRIVSGAGHRLRHDPRAVAILLGWLDRERNRVATSRV